MKKRRKARELVLQTLYGLEISENGYEYVIQEIQNAESYDMEISEFAVTLIRKIMINEENLDRDIATMVQNWEFKRVALMDRLILRLALCELLYFEDIPPKVTINEAIDLAKKFSTAESGRFVNGVLDGLYKRLKTENRIIKAGRGLLE